MVQWSRYISKIDEAFIEICLTKMFVVPMKKQIFNACTERTVNSHEILHKQRSHNNPEWLWITTSLVLVQNNNILSF